MGEASRRLTLTVLGSGTSVGVPTIGCHCKVCTSTDPRDTRLRPSVCIRWDNHVVMIDTGPDFRLQALTQRLDRLDAVLYTHPHADHILGLDDLRPFNYRQKEPIPIYASAFTMDVIRRIFSYIFHDGPTESSRPKIEPRVFDGTPIMIDGIEFKPIPVKHGSAECHGYRFGRTAYLTDHSDIPEESLALLEGLDVLFLDALRYKPHPTHSTVDQSLKTVARLKPKTTYFTHISHDLLHARAQELLPENVFLAYDGLEIAIDA
ncbi:MBL fold metallo-hydrolase [uncultured Paludibaculum sp.]|uniref:MBL fold metallo-hydrolase n=1 Tax=uncultured Paludibaculum sp. TaxID=1765020 RepID=UPI002AABD930|nr:MBL fold metallo-hydrolase [uncultured Paludibaculum sp.]